MLRNGIWNASAEDRIQIYSELTPQGRIDAGRSIATYFSRSDPVRAEAWVKELPAGPARVAAVHGFVAYQASYSPDRSAELVEAWPTGPERNAALRAVASAQTDPIRGMEFARRVDDPAVRELAFESIARNWMYRDKAAAAAWIASSPDLAPWQKRLLLRQAQEQ
jgi:hypothetical protein